MSKKRMLCLVLAVLLLFSGCSSARGSYRQLKSSPFLHAKEDKLLSSDGKEISLKIFPAEPDDFAKQISFAKQNGYNMISLELPYTDIADNWKLTDSGISTIKNLLSMAEQSDLLLSFAIDTEDTDNIWVAESDSLAALWGEVALLCKEENALGAYNVSFSYRPQVTDQTSSLSIYEKVLQKIAKRIRKSDPSHLILVSQIPQYAQGVDSYYGLPALKDKNFAYVTELQNVEFYTAQQSTEKVYDFLCYPNSFCTQAEGEVYLGGYEGASLDVAIQRTPQVIATNLIKIPANDKEQYAEVGIDLTTDGGGEVWIDTLKVEQFDANDALEKTVVDIDNTKGLDFVRFDSPERDVVSEPDEDSGTCYIPYISENSIFTLKDLKLPVESGKQYKVTLTVRQLRMQSGQTLKAGFHLFEADKRSAFDKDFLLQSLQVVKAESDAVKVPLIISGINLSEGVTNEKGRETFIKDFREICKNLSIGLAGKNIQ